MKWRIWRWVKIVFAALVILYVAAAFWRVPYLAEEERSAKVAQEIQNAHITMADVDGSHLPPEPDPKLVDATVEGIDANQNGIRDDVELAIFKKYPGAANLKIRAAALQYAHALQFYMTSVFSVETLTAASWQDGRAYTCLSNAFPNKPSPSASDEEWRPYDALTKAARTFVKNSVMNMQIRQDKYEQVYEKFMSSHGGANENFCDLP